MSQMEKCEIDRVNIKLIDTPDTLPTGVEGLAAQKQSTIKRIAQGLEVVLITENVNQLKFIIQTNGHHPFYLLVICLICTSIVIQVTIGLSILCIGPLSINKKSHRSRSKLLNVTINTLIFLVLVINIFISSLVSEQGQGIPVPKDPVVNFNPKFNMSCTNLEALKKLIC